MACRSPYHHHGDSGKGEGCHGAARQCTQTAAGHRHRSRRQYLCEQCFELLMRDEDVHSQKLEASPGFSGRLQAALDLKSLAGRLQHQRMHAIQLCSLLAKKSHDQSEAKNRALQDGVAHCTHCIKHTFL